MKVVHAAGADVPGVLRFSPRMNGHVAASDEASVEVRALTVDELTTEYGAPQVLFVDVEGYELHVLRGARRTLESHRPDLFVEVHVGEGLERFGNADDLLALIPSGYEILVSRTERGPYRPLAVARDELRHHSRLVALWHGDDERSVTARSTHAHASSATPRRTGRRRRANSRAHLFNRLALDDAAIFAHPAIASWRALPRALVSPWWYSTGRLYRPLSLLSLGVDRQLGGGALWLPHAENLLLHAAIAALVVVLARRFLASPIAIAVGALVALLPVHVEPSRRIVGRAELLAALALVALLLLVTRTAAPTGRAQIAAALLAAAALAAKESGAVAPLLAARRRACAAAPARARTTLGNGGARSGR